MLVIVVHLLKKKRKKYCEAKKKLLRLLIKNLSETIVIKAADQLKKKGSSSLDSIQTSLETVIFVGKAYLKINLLEKNGVARI